jgi:hypothetical protein
MISAKRKLPVGTTFAFALSEPAKVTFTFTQSIAGRRLHGRCVALNRRNARKPRCRRTVPRGTLTFAGHAGANRVLFYGRLPRGQLLKPGRYTTTITAANAAGRSALRQLTFTIVGKTR